MSATNGRKGRKGHTHERRGSTHSTRRPECNAQGSAKQFAVVSADGTRRRHKGGVVASLFLLLAASISPQTTSVPPSDGTFTPRSRTSGLGQSVVEGQVLASSIAPGQRPERRHRYSANDAQDAKSLPTVSEGAVLHGTRTKRTRKRAAAPGHGKVADDQSLHTGQTNKKKNKTTAAAASERHALDQAADSETFHSVWKSQFAGSAQAHDEQASANEEHDPARKQKLKQEGEEKLARRSHGAKEHKLVENSAKASSRVGKHGGKARAAEQRREEGAGGGWGVAHPFATEYGDHFETGSAAYGDIAPLLARFAACARRRPAQLRIYDPYYCNGAPPPACVARELCLWGGAHGEG